MQFSGREQGVKGAARRRRARRLNPTHRVDLLRPGHYMTYVKATADPDAPAGGVESAPSILYATNLADLSAAVREWIMHTGTGATSYAAGLSGRVFDDNGMPVAYISYNGRIWEAGEAGRRGYEITGKMARAPLRRRLNPANPGKYDDSQWVRDRVRAMPAGLTSDEVRERLRLVIARDDAAHNVITDRNTREAMLRSAVKMYGEIHPSRRANPGLAILNPLPDHLAQFARDQQLTPAELEEFNQAIARYCEFHGVGPEAITLEQIGETDGEGVKFLVGMGATEDVSYSANHKNAYQKSNKRGTPFRHEFPSKPHMATTPDGGMIVIVNRPGKGKRFSVSDWIRG